MSIDRQAITDSITKGGQIPAFTFTPPNTQGYFANNNSIRYDIAHAQISRAKRAFQTAKASQKSN